MSFVWEERYTCGVQEVDNQHEQLVEIYGRLQNALQAGAPHTDLLNNLMEVQDFAEFHFAREETLMLQAGYPGLAQHQQRHAEFLQIVSRGVASMTWQGKPLSQNTLDAMLEWVTTHLPSEDAQMGKFLVTHG